MKRVLVLTLVVLCTIWAISVVHATDGTSGTAAATYQPDASIRNNADTAFVGDKLILDPNEMVSQTGAGPFVYVVRVKNAGSGADSITVKASKIDSWTLTFSVAGTNSSSTDISSDVLGNGHPVQLAAGAYADVTVKLVPGTTLKTGAAASVLVYAISTKDTSKADKVIAKATLQLSTVANPPASDPVFQPDVMIRGSADATFVGEGIFDESLETRTLAQTAGPFQYVVRVKNPATADDTITVKAVNLPTGWTVACGQLDAAGQSTDISSAMTGDGAKLTIPAGHSVDILVKLTPDHTVAAGASANVGFYCSDGKKTDACRAIANLTAPLAHVQLVAPANIATGVGLTAELSWNKLDGATTYWVQVANDEKFTSPAIDIKGISTTTLHAGIGVLKPNTKYWWHVISGTGNTYSSLQMSETWTFTTNAGDPAPYKPDALIRTAAETDFTGDNVINTDATNQMKYITTSASISTGSFVIRVVNKGAKSDTMHLVATAGTTEWAAKYTCNGQDITAQITGNGYAVALDPAATVDVTLDVTPLATLAPNAYHNFLVQVKSTGDSTKGDAVRATVVQGQVPPPPKFSVVADPATGGAVGQAIKLTATGLTGTYEYKYFIGVNGSWTQLRAYSTEANTTWTPTASGTFDILCWARKVGSTKDWEVNATLWSYVVGTTAPRAVLVANPTTCKAGATVTLTASVSGVKTPEYAFYTSNGSAWTLLQAYGSASSAKWTHALAGKYALVVYVREHGSTVTYQLNGLIKEFVVNAK